MKNISLFENTESNKLIEQYLLKYNITTYILKTVEKVEAVEVKVEEKVEVKVEKVEKVEEIEKIPSPMSIVNNSISTNDIELTNSWTLNSMVINKLHDTNDTNDTYVNQVKKFFKYKLH